MSPIDKDIIQRKITIILDEISHLKSFLNEKIDFEKDYKSTYSMIFSVQKAISAVLDLSTHIVVSETKKVPDTYAEAVLKLGELNFIPKAFAKELTEMAAFRNKVVHGYDEIDPEKVYSYLKQMITDLKKLINYINK